MRVHILSDLHLEFAPFQPACADADVVVLAGDIHTGKNGIRWILTAFPKQPVIYVLGNHEFYGQKIPSLVEQIKEIAQGTNVHVLENDELRIGHVKFLGATLWTDFRLNGDPILAEVSAQTGMTDFRRIRVTPSYRRFRPRDARQLHHQSSQWIQEHSSTNDGETLVVVTHHAPSPRAIPPRFQDDPLNPAFASNLESLITKSQAALWIYGHIHNRADFRIGRTRVTANPRGYPTEPHTGFDPELVVEV